MLLTSNIFIKRNRYTRRSFEVLVYTLFEFDRKISLIITDSKWLFIGKRLILEQNVERKTLWHLTWWSLDGVLNVYIGCSSAVCHKTKCVFEWVKNVWEGEKLEENDFPMCRPVSRYLYDSKKKQNRVVNHFFDRVWCLILLCCARSIHSCFGNGFFLFNELKIENKAKKFLFLFFRSVSTRIEFHYYK